MTRDSFCDRGRLFAVPAALLDLVQSTHGIPESVLDRLRDESRRIITPLVWTEEDLPDPVDVVDTLVHLDRVSADEAEGLDTDLTPFDYDDAVEFEYVVGLVNSSLEEVAARLALGSPDV